MHILTPMIPRCKFPLSKNFSFYFKRQFNILIISTQWNVVHSPLKEKDEKPPFYPHTRQTTLGPNDKNIQRKIWQMKSFHICRRNMKILRERYHKWKTSVSRSQYHLNLGLLSRFFCYLRIVKLGVNCFFVVFQFVSFPSKENSSVVQLTGSFTFENFSEICWNASRVSLT